MAWPVPFILLTVLRGGRFDKIENRHYHMTGRSASIKEGTSGQSPM